MKSGYRIACPRRDDGERKTIFVS